MKKIKINLILLIALVPLLTFCGGVRDALEGKKRSEQRLPTPGDDLDIKSQTNNDEVKDLLKIKDDNNSEGSSSGSDLLNNMKKKIQ